MSACGQQPDCEGSTNPECGQANITFNQMVKSIAEGASISDPEVWTRLSEYSYCDDRYSRNLVDGAINTEEYFAKEEGVAASEALLDDLVTRHCWNDDTFATFDSPAVVNAKDAAHMNGNPLSGGWRGR